MNKLVIYALIVLMLVSSVFAAESIVASKNDFVQLVENTDHCLDCHTIYKITKAADSSIDKFSVDYYDMNHDREEQIPNDDNMFLFSFEDYENYTEEVPVYEPCTKEVNRTIDNETGETGIVTINDACIVKLDTVEKQMSFYQPIAPEGFITMYNDAKLGDSFYVKVSGKLNLGDAIDNVISIGDYVFDEYIVWNATGGTMYGDGDYVVHVFTFNGTFSVIGDPINATVLVVAGGGGGSDSAGGGGGGGAGGLVYVSSLTLNESTSYPVIVGHGGLGAVGSTTGTNGTNSSFANLSALGGGFGSSDGPAVTPGGNGGSGGGGAYNYGYGNGLAGQGNNGGSGSGATSAYGGGGGGGAGGVGGDGSGSAAGNGGIGINYSINGTNTYYGGGGGGGVYGAVSTSTGGLGGGGNGGGTPSHVTPTAGTNGTGGGGGGHGTGGANGGTGIVIIRYLNLSLFSFTVNESLGREAILAGVNASEIGSSCSSYQDKQVYERLANSSQYKGTFDVFVVSGNKRWAFNYDQNSSSSFPSMFNITPVFYVWQQYNRTYSSIMSSVQSLIDNTN